MKEALEKGYLGEKLIIPKSFKITEAMDEGIAIVAETKGKDPFEWVREVIADALVKADHEHERSTRARMRRSNQRNSLAYIENKSPSAGTDELSVQ